MQDSKNICKSTSHVATVTKILHISSKGIFHDLPMKLNIRKFGIEWLQQFVKVLFIVVS